MGQASFVNLKEDGTCRKHYDSKSEDTAIPELVGGK